MRRQELDRILAALAERRGTVLVTDLASGEGNLVDPWRDDGGLEPEVLAAARQAAGADQSVRLERPGGALFLRVFNPTVQVVIVGAVHIAQSLARMVPLAGWDVLVVDPRRSFATEERFRGVPLSFEWPDEALARAGLGRRSAVVTMTHDPKIDDPALLAALRSEAFYVGALGSKKTQAARRERLRAAGLGEADLARIHGPVGLQIGALSPGEIAVAVMAEMVECARHPRPAAPGA
jgi:xanthine dehydrogenase accessory factor